MGNGLVTNLGAPPQTVTATPTMNKARIPAIYPWPLGNLVIPPLGYGLGNPAAAVEKNQAMPWRDQVALFVFTNAAGVLTLSADSKVPYFAAGQGDVIPASTSVTIKSSLADTNIYQGGGPIPRDWLFAAVAVGVTVQRPFLITGGARHYPEWLAAEGANGQSYGQILRELMFDSLSLNVSYKDQTQNFDLGSVSHYPPADGVYGNGTPRLNGGFGVQSMIPIPRGPIYMGAVNEISQAIIVAQSVNQALVVDAQTVVATGDVYVPVRLTAYGDSGPWCGPCSPSPGDVDAMIAARLDKSLDAILNAKIAQLMGNR